MTKKTRQKWKGSVISKPKIKSKSSPTLLRVKRKFTGIKTIRRKDGLHFAIFKDNKVEYHARLKGSGYRNSKEDKETAFRIYKQNGTFNQNVKRYKGKNFVVYDEFYSDKKSLKEFEDIRRQHRYNRSRDLTAPEGQKNLKQFILDQKFQIRKKRKKTIFNPNKDNQGIIYGRQNRTVQILCTLYYRVGRSRKIKEVTASSNKIGSELCPDEKSARELAFTRAMSLLNQSIDGERGYDKGDTKAMLKLNSGAIDIVDLKWGVRRYDNK